MNKGTARENVKEGLSVGIILKQDQRSGKITRGVVKRILTNASFHPHGIKVELEDGRVGRVKEIHQKVAG
ncbi:MAG: YwbE family protein [Candidatus Methanoperedens sp.]|nr:YwbE family protein [Candidatus Methanoperedens sp.]MCZ7361252.1 YwbE family protein [Candidatus Methanoperedens sp.]HLB71160.1 YwbE family protein [Candidatus Methanoperedens sp.]